MGNFIKKYLEDWKLLGSENGMTLQLEKGTGYEPDKDAVGLVYEYSHLLSSIELKSCYKNSLLASLVNDDLEYWEGFYVTEGIPLPLNHAFNVKEGKVVDFTAVKFNISVEEYWGIQVPKEVLEAYMETEQFYTALQFYFMNYSKKV